MQLQRPCMIKTPSNLMHLPCGDISIHINKNRLPYDWVLRRTSFYVYIYIVYIIWYTVHRYTLRKIYFNATAITTHPPLFGQLVCCSIFFAVRSSSSLLFEWRRRRLCTHPNNKTTSNEEEKVRGIIQQSTWWQIKQYTIYITLNIQQSTMANQTI